jgi:1,4-dihydroxy-2-naphthoate octaprenyltransferase
MAGSALVTGLVTLAIAALVGVYFLVQRGWGLLPLGLLGLIVIYAYTLWLVRVPFLSLIAPGLGFGPLMVMGAYYALTGHYSILAFVASLVPFFLVSDLLLLNQFPDAEPDQTIGRSHYPITIGRRKSSLIYGAFLLLAYGVILIGVITGLFPALALIALITLALAVPAARGAYLNADNLPALAQPMGFNVIINILTPLLLGLGLLLG